MVHLSQNGAFYYYYNYSFDNCIISNQYDSLFTNDLQFAYKAKTSTIHCVSSIFETANYYVSSAGAVHEQCRSSTCMHVRCIKGI